MIKLLDIDNLKSDDIYQIWKNVSNINNKEYAANTNIAWSFEGNGIRTRTTFIQSFQELGLNYVELPNFLKTSESMQDLAGYMDSFYSMYVIRDNNNQKMTDFASATTKPVINAMSSEAHPCEVLTDAYYLTTKFQAIQDIRILLWGPVTNVFKSWHSLSKVLNLNITHFCPMEEHCKTDNINYTEQLTGKYDVIITDAWPSNFSNCKYRLSEDHLLEIGKPILLPTPPVSMGKELDFSPNNSPYFAGYTQKALLLSVQKTIIQHLLIAIR